MRSGTSRVVIESPRSRFRPIVGLLVRTSDTGDWGGDAIRAGRRWSGRGSGYPFDRWQTPGVLPPHEVVMAKVSGPARSPGPRGCLYAAPCRESVWMSSLRLALTTVFLRDLTGLLLAAIGLVDPTDALAVPFHRLAAFRGRRRNTAWSCSARSTTSPCCRANPLAPTQSVNRRAAGIDVAGSPRRLPRGQR